MHNTGLRSPLDRKFKIKIPEKSFLVFNLLVLALVLLSPSYGQEYCGTIRGTVADLSGAVIPNASIQAVGPTQTQFGASGYSGTRQTSALDALIAAMEMQ